MRGRPLIGLFLVVFGIASGVSAAEPPYYLALGDSLAIGIQPKANGAYMPTNQGYTDDLYALYRARIPGLRLMKLGCSGETTGSMIAGIPAGSPCTYPSGSQLAEAVVFAKTHKVVLITLDIGASNLLGCLNLSAPIDPACVSAAATTASLDLLQILGILRTSAPQSLIAGMNFYDPFLAAWVLGPTGPQLAVASQAATTAFNSALDAVYQSMSIPVANVAGAFRTSSFPLNVLIALTWTWMGAPPPRGPDIHPNAIGYAAIAAAFAAAISAP